MSRFESQTVVVTGAGGGIGKGIAARFAAEGARVVLAGRARARELQDWVAQQDWRERALVVRADVREPASLATAFSSAVDAFGRVDACIANAGAWPAPEVPLHEADERRIRETLDVNLLGALWTARAFLAALARTGPRADGHGASLVFVGSTAGRFGEAGHAEYATAKAGLVGLMRSLKNEIVRLDPFGRVNLVEPGWTVTHMVRPALGQPGTIAKVLATMPVRQLGRAADVAAAIAWLCSPLAARHVSGQTLTLAGGMEGRQLWTDDEIDEAAVRLRARE